MVTFSLKLAIRRCVCVCVNALRPLLVGRVFANAQGVRDSILSRVILKTQKIALDAALVNTQHYKVRIKGKVE